MAAPEPREGEIWRHHSGRLYWIVCITNLPDEEKYPKTVVYRNSATGSAWSRPLWDWHRSFTFVEAR